MMFFLQSPVSGLNGVSQASVMLHRAQKPITKDTFFADIVTLCFTNRLPGPVSGFPLLALHCQKTKAHLTVV